MAWARSGGWKVAARGIVALLALWVAGKAPGAEALPGALRVAACEGEFWPFVMRGEDGSLFGHDVSLWSGVVNRTRLNAGLRYATAVAEDDDEERERMKGLLEALGTESAPLDALPLEEILRRLGSGDVDVGLCGIHVTAEHQASFGFLPPHLHSGIKSLVRQREATVPLDTILKLVLGTRDQFAVFALQLLLVFAVVYAHAIWHLEKKVNAGISERYADGLWDSMWLAMVTSATVGYGDKTPVTYFGKLLTLAWMTISMYFVGLFVASITTSLFNTRNTLSLESNTLHISSTKDLKSLRVGALPPSMTQTLDAQHPSASSPAIFSTQFDAVDALLSDNLDVLVGDLWQVTYLAQVSPKYRGLVTGSGEAFDPVDVGVAIGSKVPPDIAKALSVGMLEHVRGEGKERYEEEVKLLLGETGGGGGVEDEIAKTLRGFNEPVSITLALLFLTWVALVVWSNWRRIRASDRRRRLREVLGLGRGTFSQVTLKQKASLLYRSILPIGQKQATADQLISYMARIGQRVSLKDVVWAIQEHQHMLEEALQKPSLNEAVFLRPEASASSPVLDAGDANAPSPSSPDPKASSTSSSSNPMIQLRVDPSDSDTAGAGSLPPSPQRSTPAIARAKGSDLQLLLAGGAAASFQRTASSPESASVVMPKGGGGREYVKEGAFFVLVGRLVEPKVMDRPLAESHRPVLEHHLVELRDDMTRQIDAMQRKMLLEVNMIPSRIKESHYVKRHFFSEWIAYWRRIKTLRIRFGGSLANQHLIKNNSNNPPLGCTAPAPSAFSELLESVLHPRASKDLPPGDHLAKTIGVGIPAPGKPLLRCSSLETPSGPKNPITAGWGRCKEEPTVTRAAAALRRLSKVSSARATLEGTDEGSSRSSAGSSGVLAKEGGIARTVSESVPLETVGGPGSEGKEGKERRECVVSFEDVAGGST